MQSLQPTSTLPANFIDRAHDRFELGKLGSGLAGSRIPPLAAARLAAVLAGYPDTLGVLHDYESLAKETHDAGALLVVAAVWSLGHDLLTRFWAWCVS